MSLSFDYYPNTNVTAAITAPGHENPPAACAIQKRGQYLSNNLPSVLSFASPPTENNQNNFGPIVDEEAINYH